MRAFLRVVLPAFAPLVLFAALATAAPPSAPPVTTVKEVRETLHGVEISDPYRWLEDQNSPETRAWIEEQTRYTHDVLAEVGGREAIESRLEPLLKAEGQSTPIERAGRLFFARRRADQEQSVLYVRGADGKDEVLVDPHPLSADRTTSVSYLDVTEDGSLVAYATREGGADEVTVTLLDVATRRPLVDALPKARYFGVNLRPDRRGLYYSKFEATGPRVYYHAMGTDPASDERIFGDGYGPENIIGARLSENGRWLLLGIQRGSASDETKLVVRNVETNGPWTWIVKDQKGSFTGDFAGDRLYVTTTWEAPRGRVLRMDLNDAAAGQWTTVVPEGEDVIEGTSLVGGRLFVNYLHDVASRVQVFDADGKRTGAIAFPTLGSVSGLAGSWTSPNAYFTFASFHVPTTIYRYAAKRGTKSEWWRSPVPVKSDAYALEQVWFTSKDGTRVPMFVGHRKGLKLDGTNPTMLTGYGGFQQNMRPTFSARAVAWMDAGGVFALPNLRGGSEFGEAWHRAGMLEHKQNTFDDFIAAAEALIAMRYTSSQKLAILGGSNGGLLVGACMTQRPELYRAVVCSVPLLDMLRYHQFLVARFWVPEYGSSEDPQQFEWLRAYSPYQHVKAGEKYPAVLFVSGDSDTRVAPLHARKMTALVQASSASGLPVLLQYDTKSGHAGGKPVRKQIEDLADELQFLEWQLGMIGVPGAPSALEGSH